ncbi:MAG: hypothetical protein Q4E38_09760 [Eubacteriales bacterium]|nr:hypothetical protein [Eubacteriales bacterium]
MKHILRHILPLLLCLCLLVSIPAFADEGASGILDEAELQSYIEKYISDHGINPEHLSVGFVYTATGDTWYYNPDFWYYSASIYKVPLMMILAEKEYNGEITRDTSLKGLTLGYAEEIILTHSHNDYAHLMMSVVADTEPDCRELYKRYVDLPDDYYISDFRDYSYFTARFMTQVMTTLYNDPERFPNIIECLLPAQPDHYFRLYVKDYEIAQKYGSFRDYSNRDFNHTTGFIYTPNPIILTVMTQDVPQPEITIGELAQYFTGYALQLDEKLESYRTEQEAARLAAEEEARRLEEERLASEQAAVISAEEVSTETEPLPETASTLPDQLTDEAVDISPLTVLQEPTNINGENQRSRLFVLTGTVIALAVLLLIGLRRLRRR